MATRAKEARVAAAGLVAVGLAVTVAAGCNWSRFADEAEKAPVRSVAPPSGFDSADFGKSITPLSSGQGSAAAFIATSLNESHLVLVKVDRNGSVHSYTVSGGALSDTVGSALTSVAEVPGSSPTKLLLGSPVVKGEQFGRIYTFDLPDPAVLAANPGMPVGSGSVTTFNVPTLTVTDSGMGRGLAAGFLAGNPAAPDYVVGSDNELAVAVDGAATTSSPTDRVVQGACDVAYDSVQDNRYFVHRPLLTAHLWTDPAAPAADQLIVGLTHGGAAPGKLEFMNVDATGTLNCLTVEVGTKGQFGHALSTGDFDGDGNLDLLVGAPGQQAFVYRNFAAQPFGVVPPAPLAISMPGGVDFGYAVTALNVDGEPGDEALISDPLATSADGKANAGHVLVYKYDPASAAMVFLKEIADLSPETDAKFGYTVNALPFCTADTSTLAGGACPATATARVLLVGAANEVFLYYRVGDIPLQGSQSIPDVRTP